MDRSSELVGRLPSEVRTAISGAGGVDPDTAMELFEHDGLHYVGVDAFVQQVMGGGGPRGGEGARGGP